MVQTSGNFSSSAWLTHEQTRRKIVAFFVTAGACCALLCLLWPLTVAGFKSESTMAVDVSDDSGSQQEFQSLLAEVIRSRTLDQNLERLVERVRQETGLENVCLNEFDLDAIRRSISIRALPDPNSESMQVRVAFHGNGTDDEGSLARLLAQELSDGLAQATRESLTSAELTIDYGPQNFNNDASTSLQAAREAVVEFEQLDWLVAQIENDLSTICQTVESMTESNSMASANPFRSASHSNSKLASLSEVQQALKAIDTSALRERLQELQTVGTLPTTVGKNVSPEIHSYTKPVGGIPGWGELFFIGILSTLIGTVVSSNYRPFHASGFDNVNQLAARLQIPVIATIRSSQFVDQGKKSASQGIASWKNQPWANQIVAATKLLLLGMLVFVVGSCLVSQELRQTFLQDPFLGICKMVWMFVAY